MFGQVRTRYITDKLSYKTLVNKKIIPDVLSLLDNYPEALKRRNHPPFVYKNTAMSDYGLMMDYIVRAGFRIHLTDFGVNIGNDPYNDYISSLCDIQMVEALNVKDKYETSKNIFDVISSSHYIVSNMTANQAFSSEQILKNVGIITNIIKELSNKMIMYKDFFKGELQFNVELSKNDLSGHPDMMFDNVILDIKTTSSFKGMADQSMLQVLAYYALAKEKYHEMRYVGFVLPNQRELAIFDVGDWDHTNYLNLLVEKARKINEGSEDNDNRDKTKSGSGKKTDKTNDKIDYMMAVIGKNIKTAVTIKGEADLDKEGMEILNKVGKGPDLLIGHCIGKGKNISNSILDYCTRYPGCPMQTRLRSKTSCKINAKTFDHIDDCAKIVSNTGAKCFVHAPYTINLAKDATDDKTGEKWAQNALNSDLELSNKMGFKGVVVHLGNTTCKDENGKKYSMDEEEALNTMEKMVRESLKYATETCPLLLETGCGEKGELCCQLEQLALFFYRFDEQERKKLGLCVDTCHVWVSGTDPETFLTTWVSCFDVPIKLIHFNDSKTEFNSRADRHASIGSGTIGYKKLLKIAMWATDRNIPLVIE